jgi:hypothetical protein
MVGKIIQRQIKYVEEEVGANLLNLNEATYYAAVAGRDALVEFIHAHEQEYVDYVRQNCSGYADREVVKEFGYDDGPEPEETEGMGMNP